MPKNFTHLYEHGPTTCRPTPDVEANIQTQISNNIALSRGDIRLATAMGLINADTIRPLGFNDSIIYPLEELKSPSAMIGASKVFLSTKTADKAPPQTRTMHALALLVDFSDNVGHRPKADFDKLLFDATNPQSMTSYYKKISNGLINVKGEVTNYVRMPNPYSYYTSGQSGMGSNFPNNTPGLLVDALNIFCKTDNLKRFDLDNDGYVDGIFLIHAGGGAEAEPNPAVRPNKIWSHKWVLPTPFTNKGVKVYAYSTEPEDGRVGVFAHEFGHVLGLPDLYDSTYRSKGVGTWCLMGGGSWGGQGNQPTRMSCWCLAKLGWVVPNIVTKPGTLSLSTLENNPKDCYRLWTKGQSGTEYFLIENRQQVAQDSALPGSGLALWHIDETQSSNTNPLSYLVGLVQADGKRDLEFNRNDGESADLFPGTNNVTKVTGATNPSTRSNNGITTGVTLSDISQNTGIITLKVKV